jgi:hypothetical protein
MKRCITFLTSRTTILSNKSLTTTRPDFSQGKNRIQFDQPAKWNKYTEARYALNDDERETFIHEPFIGVDHLYEAHLGSKERPVIVEQMGVHGHDIIVGCLGGCHPDASEGGPFYMYVPPNALAVCADCGLHFIAKCNEEVTFWPDGTQPINAISFQLVEEAIYRHIRYGSPLLM